MKIKKITVENFKAISKEVANFNGCSAIITGGNNRGKTSLLSGLIKRIQGEKPELIVKTGEEKGVNSIELTDGSVLEWTFTEKSERITFTTKEGVKQTSGVISGIGAKYFGARFDIDAFLNKSPKQQLKELQVVLGLDLSEIEERYKEAYDERTEANRELNRLRSFKVEKPKKVEEPDLDDIRKEFKEAREKNEKRMRKDEKLNGIKSEKGKRLEGQRIF